MHLVVVKEVVSNWIGMMIVQSLGDVAIQIQVPFSEPENYTAKEALAHASRKKEIARSFSTLE